MKIQNNHWVIKLIGITIVKMLEAKLGKGVTHSQESAYLVAIFGVWMRLQTWKQAQVWFKIAQLCRHSHFVMTLKLY